MESQEQKEQKKTSPLLLILGVIAIVIGGFAIYKTGLIPGIGGGANVAQQLKTDIESLKGNNVQTKILEIMKSDKFASYATPEEKKQLQQDLDTAFKDAVVSLEYKDIQTSSGDGKGTVTLINPTFGFTTKSTNSGGEFTAPKFIISRSVANPRDYTFHSEGDLDFYTSENGNKTKAVTIQADEPANEVKFDDQGNVGFFKSTAKNVKFIEGRGNTILFTISEVYSEGSQSKNGTNLEASAKMSLKNIIPGDMMKIMLGAIEPITVNIDYAYKGENPNEYFNRIMKQENAAATDAPVKGFDGDLALNDISVMMGNAGIAVNAKLNFKKDNTKSMPSGTINLKIAQYQKLIDYFKKFVPMQPGQVDNGVKFLSDLGQNKDGNITLDIKLDGTENVLIGGKNTEQVKALEEKYFPKQASPYAPTLPSDGAKPAPAAPVQGKPIIENQTKI